MMIRRSVLIVAGELVIRGRASIATDFVATSADLALRWRLRRNPASRPPRLRCWGQLHWSASRAARPIPRGSTSCADPFLHNVRPESGED